MWSTFKAYLTPPMIIGAVAVISVVSVGTTLLLGSRKPSAAYVNPTMGPLVEEVDTTGSVKAADEIDLGFQIGGKIANPGPAVGTRVGAGQTLGALSSADLQAAVDAAQAALEVQQANLASLQAGATPQSLAVSQTAVANAQASLAQAKQSVIAAAQDAYAKSDDAVHNKVDQFINNARTATPSLAFTLSNSQDQQAIVNQRVQIEQLLGVWQQYLSALPSDQSQIDTAALASQTRDNINQVSAYLGLAATGLTEAVPSGSYTTATIQGYESNVATARANISTDLSSINSAATAVTTAQSALASAQSQLALTQAPATQNSLDAQEAQVAAAQASLDAAKAQLGKSVISAPISGTVTVNNMEPGEIAAAGTPEISMISDSQFQFETYVSQTDIAKIKVGDPANVQLDAYQGDAPFSAHVTAVDPAATVQNGISSYKVTLQFDQNDPRIQSGGTGSTKITTQSLQNVLSVPTSAIITNNTDHFVIEKTPSGDQQVPVQVGISSAGGYTQITSGLSATDEIRSFGTQQ
ncbi:MAG TPA: efflux RND transporter periplasmic adaptor subunit [Candidatus Paceibacterota bacterium]|nr:efflux RND transporter periplasmic adaptor subunit [Candidatus Paceibacterota bacterium]